jgi:serine/threonine-protein kinase RsbW
VTYTAAPESLQLVHEAVTRFWEQLGNPPADDWRMLFELAVAEVAANIVEHARPQMVDLRLSERGGCVVAEFTDTGNGWAGPSSSGPSSVADQAAELAERGRGLTLARTALDEVVYERVGEVNRWRLLKWL